MSLYRTLFLSALLVTLSTSSQATEAQHKPTTNVLVCEKALSFPGFNLALDFEIRKQIRELIRKNPILSSKKSPALVTENKDWVVSSENPHLRFQLYKPKNENYGFLISVEDIQKTEQTPYLSLKLTVAAIASADTQNILALAKNIPTDPNLVIEKMLINLKVSPEGELVWAPESFMNADPHISALAGLPAVSSKQAPERLSISEGLKKELDSY